MEQLFPKVSNSTLFSFLIGLILCSLVFWKQYLPQNEPQKELYELSAYFAEEYKKDSVLVVNNIQSSEEEWLNFESIYDVDITKKDSLAYWYDAGPDQPNGNDQVIRNAFKIGNYEVSFSKSIGSKVFDIELESIPYQYKPSFKFEIVERGKYGLYILDQLIQLKKVEESNSNYLTPLFFLIWILGFIFLLRALRGLLFRDFIFSSKVLQFGLNLFGIILIWLFFGRILPQQMFAELDISKSMAGHSVVKSLTQLIFDVLTLGYLIGYFYHPSFQGFLRSRKGIVRYATGSFVSTFILLGINYLTEKFGYYGDVLINVEEVLKVSPITLLFYAIICIVGFLVLYSSIAFFKSTEAEELKLNDRIWGIIIGASIATLVSFFTLDITNILYSMGFAVTLLLVIDTLLDYKFKKVIYSFSLLFLMASYIAFSLFYVGLRSDMKSRKERIEQIFVPLSSLDKDRAISFVDTIIDSKLIPEFANLSNQASLDKNDIMELVSTSFNNSAISENYEIKNIEFYDQSGNSLFFNHVSNYQSNKDLIRNSDKVSNNLYHIPLSSRLTFYFPVDNPKFTASTLTFIIKLGKKNINQKLKGTELLILKDDRLIYSFTKENLYNDQLGINQITEDKIVNDKSYVVKIIDRYKIISFKEIAGLIKPLSLFSFIFLLFGILLFGILSLDVKFKLLSKEVSQMILSQNTLRLQLQRRVLTLIIICFVIIGISTALYINNQLDLQQRLGFKTELSNIINDVQNELTKVEDKEAGNEVINTVFSRLETVYNKDIAYYDKKGDLVNKSESYQATWKKIPFKDLYKIAKDNEGNGLRVISRQIAGDNILVPLYLGDIQPMGYLSLEKSEFNNASGGIFDFLGTLLNAYVFLFFLALVITIIASNSITRPLEELTNSIKSLRLGQSNRKIKWKSKDEIGSLINIYNEKVQQLEESTEIIKKTERDTAWREMAKQVAHEIKNPLTPMKLSLQYLQRAKSQSTDNLSEMVDRTAATMMEQINNLSQIATEFSNFATLPTTTNEKVNLNEVMEHIHDLFRKRDDMDVEMVEPYKEIIVFADRNHLVRILNNIVKNAIQAIPEGRRGKITMELSKIDYDAQIKISDNGSGIPDHMKDKVFTPNFTTKSSGTGLGLAISAHMIDTMNGKIYFETRPGDGTDFYIRIPLMKQEDQDIIEVTLED